MLTQQNDELRTEMAIKTATINSIDDEMERLKAENVKWMNKCNELQTSNDGSNAKLVEVNHKYAQIQQQNIELNDEQKELKMELADVKDKYNKLLRKTNLNESKYLEWDSDMIVDWILSLDQDYAEYLKKKFDKLS